MIDPLPATDNSAPISTRTLRQFAGMWVVFTVGLACWHWFVRGHATPASVFIVLALAVGPVGLARPEAIRPVFGGLMTLTYPLGWLVSHCLLAILYFAVFSPVGALLRLLGRDALLLRPRPGLQTYWKRKPVPTNARSYLRQS